MNHPGESLQGWLDELDLSVEDLSKRINVPEHQLEGILKKKIDVTADMAIRFAIFFGQPAEKWLKLQAEYNLEQARAKFEKEYKKISHYRF